MRDVGCRPSANRHAVHRDQLQGLGFMNILDLGRNEPADRNRYRRLRSTHAKIRASQEARSSGVLRIHHRHEIDGNVLPRPGVGVVLAQTWHALVTEDEHTLRQPTDAKIELFDPLNKQSTRRATDHLLLAVFVGG